MRLLIVEDEEDLADAIARGLRKQGYVVDIASDGEQGLELAQVYDYDLLILDLTLPLLDGLEVCERLRESQPNLLILILTARTQPYERAFGLNSGADDYLCKPFDWSELLARVRALLRRDIRARTPLLRHGNLTLDPTSMMACVKDCPIGLTTKEFGILEYLMRHRGEVVTHQQLLDHVWDASGNSFSNVVPVHVSSLRRKLGEAADKPLYIETVIGKGYRIRPVHPL